MTGLREAFPDADPPSEIVSLEGRAADAGAAEIEAELKGKPWTAIGSAVAERQARHISLLSEGAFVHYLPAFLQAAAGNPGGEAATYCAYALVPTGGHERYAQTTAGLFSGDQAAVIADVLETLESHPAFAEMKGDFPKAIGLWRNRAQAG